MDFDSDFNETATIYDIDGNELSKGTLRFSPGKNITVDINLDENSFCDKKHPILKCSCNGLKYTLVDCEWLDSIIFVSVVIKGDIDILKFCELKVVFSGVSEWFNSRNYFDIKTGSREIVRKVKTREFRATIQGRGKEFKLSNSYSVYTESDSSALKINESVVFTLEVNGEKFNVDDLLDITNDLKEVFSVLMDRSVLINSLRVKNSKNQYCDVFFTTFRIKKKPYQRRRDNFAYDNIILGDWEKLINNFYQSKYSSMVWSRLAGMINFEGFWEHRIIAVVSILERYCKIFCKGKIVPNSTGGKTPSFADNYFFVLSNSGLKVDALLNLDEADFKNIKKIRDAVAHGDEVVTKQKNDITYEVGVTDKLVLLLTYLFFKDVGLSDMDFMFSLRSFMNPTVRKAKINHLELDKAIGDTLFISVSPHDFKRLNQFNSVLFYSSKNNSFSYHSKGSRFFDDWHFSKTQQKNGAIEKDLYVFLSDDEEVNKVLYVSRMYAKSESQTQELTGACIINGNDDIDSYGYRCCESLDGLKI